MLDEQVRCLLFNLEAAYTEYIVHPRIGTTPYVCGRIHTESHYEPISDSSSQVQQEMANQSRESEVLQSACRFIEVHFQQITLNNALKPPFQWPGFGFGLLSESESELTGSNSGMKKKSWRIGSRHI